MLQAWVPAVIVDIFGLMILLVLLIEVMAKSKRFQMDDQRLFFGMLLTNLIMLILDMGTWVLDGQTFPGAYSINLFITTAYYIINPVMSFLYLCYSDIKLGVSQKTRHRLVRIYLLPILINFVLAILSIRGSYLFHIGADNVYQRGSLLAFSFILSSVLLMVTFFRVLYYAQKQRRSSEQGPMHKRPFGIYTLLFFALPPLAGGIIQIWFNQITVVWLSTILSLLIVFINIQNLEISTDVLTGLFNRRQTNLYLQSLLQPHSKPQTFTLAVLDIDNFKQINDQHGHMAGDHALKVMSNILQATCKKNEFCSRYGGDEFIIITHEGDDAYMQTLIDRVNADLAKYCKAKSLPYYLSVSAGSATYQADIETSDALFAIADARLYEQKARQRRRVSDQ